jgi:hypothetical protein
MFEFRTFLRYRDVLATNKFELLKNVEISHTACGDFAHIWLHTPVRNLYIWVGEWVAIQ